ncbi:MAG TPA: sulfite exporter TauE/SafE family protein [Clostridia bacterium]|nr:sulfite exporter TauE/SafE family protein [Clostridia bacterium]
MIGLALLVAAMNALGAFTQAATGFGYAIVAMFLMPYVLPYEQCLVISASTIVAIAVQMVVTLYRHIRLKKLLWPLVGCLATLGIGRYLISILDDRMAARVMGVFLILLAVFFYVTKRREISIKGNWRNGLAVGGVTGISTGMFNIVGPFLSLYYYDNCESTLEFKASLECSFLIAGLISLAINLSMVPLDAFTAGTAGLSAALSVAAGVVGLKVYHKLDKAKLKWIIIAVLPVMGVIQLLKG